MSDATQVGSLEAALLTRAQKLADEYIAGGHNARERILAETNQRLHIEEEREVLSAKAHAERIYQQHVQAAELNLRAELDRLRWGMVNDILAALPARIAQLAQDEPAYLSLLRGWIAEGAASIERDALLVQANARDLALLRREWPTLARQLAPDKDLQLSDQAMDRMGGVLIASMDGDIRLDNTFEGRMERLGERLQRTVADRLIPEEHPGG